MGVATQAREESYGYIEMILFWGKLRENPSGKGTEI